MDQNPIILLVEDNPNDITLTLHAFEKSRIANKIVVVQDGQEALDYLFGTGPFAGRDSKSLPEVVLLDLNLPKIDALDVLKRIRAEDTTRRVPVVVLTSSNEQSDLISSYNLGPNSFIRKPVSFTNFMQAAAQLGLYWLVLNQPVP